MKHFGIAVLISMFATGLSAAQPIMTTIAGGGPEGLPALEANIGSPAQMVAAADGNLYVAAITMHRILRIDTAGVVSVYAGTGVRAFTGAADFDGDGGPAPLAGLAFPSGIAFDAAGDLYIADAGNHRVRRVDAATGIITTFAGTGHADYRGDGRQATRASIHEPADVAFDAAGNLYIAEAGNHVIRRVDATTGTVSTVAGRGKDAGYGGDGGPAASALLNTPKALLFDAAGNFYVADTGNHRVRRVDAVTGEIMTVAGDGVPRFAGDGGPAISASLFEPHSLVQDAAGNLLIADGRNHRVRRVDAATGIITTVAQSVPYPTGLHVTDTGDLLIAEAGWPFGWQARYGNVIRRVDGVTGVISTFAGTGSERFSGDGYEATRAALAYPFGVAVEASGSVLIGDGNGLRRVEPVTGLIDTLAHVQAHDLAIAASGDVYALSMYSGRVCRVDPSNGAWTVVAGSGVLGFSGDGGPATEASLRYPEGIAVDQLDNLYIADTYNFRVRRVDAASGIITTIAGNGEDRYVGHRVNALETGLEPSDVAIDADGNLLIADVENYRILRLDLATGLLQTVAGTGREEAGPDGRPALQTAMAPWTLALDGGGNVFYVDLDASLVRRIDAVTRVVTTVAGNGHFGFSADGLPATQSELAAPHGLAVDGSGNLLIADFWQHRIRLVTGAAVPVLR